MRERLVEMLSSIGICVMGLAAAWGLLALGFWMLVTLPLSVAGYDYASKIRDRHEKIERGIERLDKKLTTPAPDGLSHKERAKFEAKMEGLEDERADLAARLRKPLKPLPDFVEAFIVGLSGYGSFAFLLLALGWLFVVNKKPNSISPVRR